MANNINTLNLNLVSTLHNYSLISILNLEFFQNMTCNYYVQKQNKLIEKTRMNELNTQNKYSLNSFMSKATRKFIICVVN